MKNVSSNLNRLLWVVIVVLLAGSLAGGILLVNHANSVDRANNELKGDNVSLRSQLKQAKATPAPQPTPAAATTPMPTALVTPTPKVK